MKTQKAIEQKEPKQKEICFRCNGTGIITNFKDKGVKTCPECLFSGRLDQC